VIAIVDKSRVKGEELARKFGAKFYIGLENLLENENIDAIDICTPTYLHPELVKKAANAGKNVFCEKPISLTLKDADEMIRVVEKNNVKAMVGHVLRFWPEYIKAKEIIESKEVGKPRYAFCERLASLPDWHNQQWGYSEKLSGGAATDMHVHDIDYLIWLFGMPEFVKAEGLYEPNLGGYAHIISNLKFKDGIIATAEAGWAFKGAFPFTMVFRILCENGTVEWIFRAGKNVEQRDQKSPIILYKADGSTYNPRVESEDPYFLELKYFIDCLDRGENINNATLGDGRRALKVVLALIKSAKENKVIEL